MFFKYFFNSTLFCPVNLSNQFIYEARLYRFLTSKFLLVFLSFFDQTSEERIKNIIVWIFMRIKYVNKHKPCNKHSINIIYHC